MSARRSNANRRGTNSRGSSGIPAWFWLLGGIFIGLGAAVVLMFRGYLPEFTERTPVIDQPVATASSPALITDQEKAKEPEKPRYDFFTVLPEMEVVVPEQELQRKAANNQAPVASIASKDTVPAPRTAVNTDSKVVTDVDRYILQVGSFQDSSEAEQMKAQLAMIGLTASVQTVTVDGKSWHRIRVGPFDGARQADETRRILVDNQYQPLVMKAKP